ncbi:MAG: hypothetical protein ABSA11_09285 [Candidatus Bathyarchaeia archaeon]|jgi:hypothetical protein
MSEQVIGVIPHLIEATGKAATKGWILVSTNQKIVLAQFSGPQMQEALALSKARAKGFMAKMLAGKVLTPTDVVEYCRKYFKMTPEQIIAETPGNFALDLPGITRAYIDYEQESRRQALDEGSHIQSDRYLLTMESNQGDYKYVFDADPQDMSVLKAALGDRVHGDGRAKALKPNF